MAARAKQPEVHRNARPNYVLRLLGGVGHSPHHASKDAIQ